MRCSTSCSASRAATAPHSPRASSASLPSSSSAVRRRRPSRSVLRSLAAAHSSSCSAVAPDKRLPLGSQSGRPWYLPFTSSYRSVTRAPVSTASGSCHHGVPPRQLCALLLMYTLPRACFLCLAVRARRESAIQVVLTGGPMGGKATLAAKLASVLTEKVHARVEAPRSIRPHGAACPPPPPQSHALRLRHDASPSRAFAATGGVARAAAHRGLRSSSPPRHPLSSSTAAAHFQQRATRKACYFSRARCAGEWHARRFPRGPAHSPHGPLCSRAHRCSAFSIALRLRSSTLRRRRVSDA